MRKIVSMNLIELIDYSKSDSLTQEELESVVHEIRKRRVMMHEIIDLNLVRVRRNLIQGE